MYINRKLTDSLKRAFSSFPVLSVTGPRQSGKTTLIRKAFPEKKYYSMENPGQREWVLNDPRGFFSANPDGCVIDEAQRTPKVFSYMQGIVDEANKPGMFVLSGSENFLLSERISQSLAGRVAIFKLFPFSLEEIDPPDLDQLLLQGLYPSIYDRKLDPDDWYPNYIETYLERDLRHIRSIKDLNAFQGFMKLCAARTGQCLNRSSLATEAGVSHTTVRDWLSILEASYIVFFVHPYYRNFKKRVTKMPKMYFYDTGLVCSLLSIRSKEQVQTHYIRGSLFETMIVSEFAKAWHNRGRRPNLGYFRDSKGHEVDLVIDRGGTLHSIEIKSGKTMNREWLKNLDYYEKLSGCESKTLIYAGDRSFEFLGTSFLHWKETAGHQVFQ